MLSGSVRVSGWDRGKNEGRTVFILKVLGIKML